MFGLTVKSPYEGVPPQFVLQLSHVEVTEGNPAKLECRVVGAPVPTVKWFRDDEPLESSDRVAITYDGQLCEVNFTVTDFEDEGEYKCIASNEFGEDSSTAELLVNEPMTPITPSPTPIVEAVMPVSKQPLQFTLPLKEPIKEPGKTFDEKPFEGKSKPKEKVPVDPEPTIQEKVAPVAFAPMQFTLPLKEDEIGRSEEHTSELQSRQYLVCRLLLEKKKKTNKHTKKQQKTKQTNKQKYM